MVISYQFYKHVYPFIIPFMECKCNLIYNPIICPFYNHSKNYSSLLVPLYSQSHFLPPGISPMPGSHDRHRLSSDTGPRTMYRVYRSGISSDAAMDPETLEKMPGTGFSTVEKGRRGVEKKGKTWGF